MEQSSDFFRLKNIRKQGFSLAEVVVALFVVSLVIIVLGSLGQQAINFSKKSRQTSGVMELRSKISNLLKDQDEWLVKMRTVVPNPGALSSKALSSCIRSAADSAIAFDCPVDVYDAAQLTADGLTELTDSNKYKVMDTPILDTMGTPIAGSKAAPVYLNSDGLDCKTTPQLTTCPLRSIGYFFRENVGATTNPGNVKFIAKVEMNSGFTAKTPIPMKAQFMTMSLGTSWEGNSLNPNVATSCVLPAVFKGIQPDGTARCEDPNQQCSASGKIQVGYTATGPICEDPFQLAQTCGTGEKVILDPVQKKLVCSSSTPCSTGGVFTGFYSGSGEPMCTTTGVCPNSNEIQMGFDSTTQSPICKSVQSCNPTTQVVTYNGSAFQCVASNTAGGACPNGEVVLGISSTGTPYCGIPPNGGTNTSTGTSTSTTTNTTTALVVTPCAAGWVLSTTSTGTLKCVDPLPDCAPGQGLAKKATGTGYYCVDALPNCNANEALVGKNNGTGFVCKDIKSHSTCSYSVFGAAKPWALRTILCVTDSAYNGITRLPLDFSMVRNGEIVYRDTHQNSGAITIKFNFDTGKFVSISGDGSGWVSPDCKKNLAVIAEDNNNRCE